MQKFDFTKTPGKLRKRFFSPSIEEALVTLVTPYYNAGKYFEETFNSVMNQTFPWFEWIIVDDGSTNPSDVKLLETYAKKDSRIIIISQKNSGPSCARNNGFAHAHTDLVVPLDADDLLAPQYLEILYWGMKYHPEAAWGYTDSYGFQDQEYIWKYPFNAKQMKTENTLVVTAMIRKQIFQEIGGYKIEKWPYDEDWRFWLEMLAKGKRPVHIDLELFWYRRMDKGRFSNIRKNPEQEKFSKDIIKDAAKKVDETVQGVEYPVRKSAYPFYRPSYEEWNRLSNPEKKGKRVLWLIPWMTMGGADKFNLDAIAGLAKKGYESCIVTTLPSPNDWKQKFEEYTDEIFCMADFLDPAHFPEFLAYFIQSRQIDILMVSNSYDGYYMLPWIRQHFPELVIVDYVHMEEWYWRAGGHARTSGALSGITEKTYVCNSATRQVMIDYFGCKEEKVDCLYIGVDSHYYDKSKEKPGYLHGMLALPQERPIVLVPCRIHEQKRPFMVLDIADGVKSKRPDIAFVIVGDGPQLEELRQTIKERNLSENVFCTGRSEKMRACYRDSTVTLICSLKEGLALTAYESCAMSVPVISSDVGGQKDLIGSDVGALIPLMQNEETDLNKRTFPEEEVEKYVSSILKIVEDHTLAEKMGKNARKKIENKFSLEKMVEQLANEFEKLCNDEAWKKDRIQLAQALQTVSGFTMDYYTIYSQWKIQEQESAEIWQARCWFQDQLNRVAQKPDSKIVKMYAWAIRLPYIGKFIEKMAQVILGIRNKN